VTIPNDRDESPAPEQKEPAVRVVDRRWWARGESAAAADDGGVRKPTYIEELERRLADSTTQVQQVLTDHRRALEDFEQMRARLRRDTGREIERARRTLLADLLEVVDNLDRAVKASRDPSTVAAPDGPERVARGIELVRDQFLGKLETSGVTRVPADGCPFDARTHEAISTAPVDDPAQDAVVIAVVKEGYAIGEDVLRPASVVVGKYTRP
jgi:molecular chaperone GrpE